MLAEAHAKQVGICLRDNYLAVLLGGLECCALAERRFAVRHRAFRWLVTIRMVTRGTFVLLVRGLLGLRANAWRRRKSSVISPCVWKIIA